jgi:hypothetical protein
VTVTVSLLLSPGWKYGVSVGQVPESPLPRAPKPLHWDSTVGMRVR